MTVKKSIALTILTQYFYPEVPATAQLTTELAVSLVQSGFQVSVYTGQPAYTDAKILPSHEIYKGIHIRRAYSRRLTRESTKSRLINGATVAAITFARVVFTRKPQVVLVDSTSPFLLVVAWLLRLLRRVPYVTLVQDVYPEIAIQLGIVKPDGIPARIWRGMYRLVYSSASRIVVLGPRMKAVVERSLKEGSDHKFTIIPNWADGKFIVPLPAEQNPLRKQLGLADKLVVLYSGNMGLVHDMETVIEAAVKLRSLPELRFLLIGGGGKKDWVESEVKKRGLSNTILLPYQPYEKLSLSLTCGDISLVTLRRGMEGLSVPSKLYSSLAAGLAVVVVAGEESEVSDVVKEHGCGFRVSQGDVEGLAKAIENLYSNRSLLAEMKCKARQCFEANYTFKRSASLYFDMLEQIACSRR